MFLAKDIAFLKTVGEGAFGRVALVEVKEDCNGRRPLLACKIIKKHFLLGMKTVENIKREIDILKLVCGYPFFPKLYSTFGFYDRLCLLMEFCGGGELFRWIRRTRGLSHKSARFYGAEILLALRKLRSLDILYRDLKSENILLTIDGHIKVIDFGLSIRTKEKAWLPVGTVECMAPEALSGSGYGHAADIWSYGVLMYEMLHCQTPFFQKDASSEEEVRMRVVREDPVFRPDADPQYVDLVESLLCKNPRLRLGSRGIEDIMCHPFFSDVDWERMERMQVTPPDVPNVFFEGDTRYFDEYKESIASFDVPPQSVFKVERISSSDIINS